jgi:hypothetical protein
LVHITVQHVKGRQENDNNDSYDVDRNTKQRNTNRWARHRDPNSKYKNIVIPTTLVRRPSVCPELFERLLSHGDISASRISGSNIAERMYVSDSAFGFNSLSSGFFLSDDGNLRACWGSDLMCRRGFLSSSPSLEGSAEVGGVESKSESDRDESEDVGEEGVGGCELVRRGDGMGLYVCRYPGDRDSGSVHRVWKIGEEDWDDDVAWVRGRVVVGGKSVDSMVHVAWHAGQRPSDAGPYNHCMRGKI